MVASPNYSLLCLHIETFRVSDSPEVSLTQVSHRCSFSYETLTNMNLMRETPSRIVIDSVQIGVTTALNLPGIEKGEFFFPVEPKGAKGFQYKIRDFLTLTLKSPRLP